MNCFRITVLKVKKILNLNSDILELLSRLLGATVARLTPDQKVACSNHVGVTSFAIFMHFHINKEQNNYFTKDMTPT